ncbi:hypothetical protein ACWDVX_08945 [Streptomyces tendae]
MPRWHARSGLERRLDAAAEHPGLSDPHCLLRRRVVASPARLVVAVREAATQRLENSSKWGAPWAYPAT